MIVTATICQQLLGCLPCTESSLLEFPGKFMFLYSEMYSYRAYLIKRRGVYYLCLKIEGGYYFTNTSAFIAISVVLPIALDKLRLLFKGNYY